MCALQVRFFYSFTSTDKLYLVMEYLNGGDLYSLLKKVGCLEEAVARTYIAELVITKLFSHIRSIVNIGSCKYALTFFRCLRWNTFILLE